MFSLKKCFIIVSIMLTGAKFYAQKGGNLTIQIDKDTAFANEIIYVDIHLDNLEGNFLPPNFEGFEVAVGPNVSSNFSIINGVVNQQKSYSYGIIATQPGDHWLDSARVETENETFSTEPIKMTVLEGKPDKPSPSKKRTYRTEPNQHSIDNNIAPKRVLKKI